MISYIALCLDGNRMPNKTAVHLFDQDLTGGNVGGTPYNQVVLQSRWRVSIRDGPNISVGNVS